MRIAGGLGLHAPGRKNLNENAAIGCVVVDDQHARAADHDWLPSFSDLGWLAAAEPRREMERAAVPDAALHPDVAMHQMDKSRGDGQAEPRAAETARGRGIRLFEFAKNHFLLLGRNSNSRIADREAQHT